MVMKIFRIKRKIETFFQKMMCLFLKKSFCKMDGLLRFPKQIEGAQYISIEKGACVGQGSILTAWSSFGAQKFNPKIHIGENTRIGEECHISACLEVTIGKNVLTGRRVYISDNNHGDFRREILDIPPIERPLAIKGPVVIEDNVWIGEHVCVLTGVTIGRGAIVAANAVVTHDVPPYSLVAGVPAKVVKQF